MKRKLIHLETSRIILRHWKVEYYTSFAEINSDPYVMKYFPKLFTRIESNILAKKIKSFIEKNGWGMWAVELKSIVNLLAL